MGDQHEEVNYIGTSTKVLMDDLNILFKEKLGELEVLLMIEESTKWLLDSGASYHVTRHRSQFRQYLARHFDSIQVRNSQHCSIIRIDIVDLNLPGDSTLVLHDVRHVLELSRPLISVGQVDEEGIRAGFSSSGWTLHRGDLMLA